MRPRYQVMVSWRVLKRNRDTGSRDPAIHVRDHVDTTQEHTMAAAVDLPTGGRIVTDPCMGAVWVEADAVVMHGARPGQDL